MERLKLEGLINKGMSSNEIAIEIGKSQTTVTYWLNKHKLKTNYNPFGTKEYGETRYCPRCKQNCKTEDFYQRRGKANSSTYCKTCTSEQTVERTRLFKFKCVEYKGGKCVRCDYDRYIGALEFHHLDPEGKDFTIAHLRAYSFSDKVKKELDKCILVCANCHREIH